METNRTPTYDASDNPSVTLSGQVKARHERKIAEDAAWAIPGVTTVRDNIVVR